MLSDPFSPDLSSEQVISFFRPGIQHRIFKKIAISAVLDLHGETVESARVVLTQFLHYCTQKHYRYVRIIHGKGHHAVLKNQIYHWLPQFPAVLAFESAAIRDGGTGAVNVLLKTVMPA
jgi:DNA-nicking Smr family endonuclease